MEDLKRYEKAGDYVKLIHGIADRVGESKRVLSDPYIKAWCKRRWKNFFLTEAVKDTDALKAASGKHHLLRRDRRPDRQKISERFLYGADRREWRTEMPPAQGKTISNTTLLYCPGFVNGVMPTRTMKEEFPSIARRFKMRILRVDAHPFRSCEANMEDISETLDHGYGRNALGSQIARSRAKAPGDVFVIGYSKGAPDWLTFQANHPEVASRVRCFFSWGGVIGGSYSADEMQELMGHLNVEIVPETMYKILHTFLPILDIHGNLRRMEEYDVPGAFESMCTKRNHAFMAKHGKLLDSLDIPIFNFTASTTFKEVPYYVLRNYVKISHDDPENDAFMTKAQASVRLPMAIDLPMVHANHFDLAYNPFPKYLRVSPNMDNPFPRSAAVVASIQLASELGLID